MRLVLAAALALAAATPALAAPADPASIVCVGQKLDAAVKAQLAVNVERNLANPGQRPSYDSAVTRGLNDATTACANERGWSGAAASASGVYALAEVGLPVARRVVQAKGFDPAALDQQFAALPEEVRRAPLTPKATQDLIRAAVTDEAQQTRANAQLLAQYFAFLNTLEYAAAYFSR
ncbi:hypothetical protein [Sphingomonas sp. R1]|uniref:hypothetical protein n=1 Tax=Sphingomonas sp. R1 TaxID=399176 RepID=UPI002224D9B6|nr:hypothetical protein [Sphingomonas sp. R1]UYY77943.1 hypothetical protein OIM94_02720 [Sphingomonas sp. R1]